MGNFAPQEAMETKNGSHSLLLQNGEATLVAIADPWNSGPQLEIDTVTLSQ